MSRAAVAGDDDRTVVPGAAPGGVEGGPLEPGTQFGPRYRIIKLLGVGGMGAVYQAWDEELGVVVALKVVRPEIAADPAGAQELERRFKRELLLARQVTHPNVVRIHDLGEVDGVKYMTMPFIDGEDLSTILQREGPLPPERAIRIMRTMLAGLVAAHRAGVVHRDLKPANLMVDADNQAMIMDFGIARTSGRGAGKGGSAHSGRGLSAIAGVGETAHGAVVGTIEYMAPEQARDEEVDERADIYAFGLICYDMLVGRTRHERAPSAFKELLKRVTAAPPPPRSVNPDVPEAIDAIIDKCLQPDPAARFQTSTEVAERLAALDDQGVPLPKVRKLTWKLMVGVGILTAALVAGTYFLARGPEPVKSRPPVSVLVSDFVNDTGEKLFDGVLEASVGAGLEAASFVSAYQRPAALRVARLISAGDRLDVKASRLVAMREGIKVVVAGRIAKQGNRYTISARGLDPTSGKQVFASEVKAGNREGVVRAAGELAKDLRSALGDTTPVEPRQAFSAGSLEAVAAFIRGQDAANAGRHAEAIEAYREATQRDPNFALAYGGLATAATRLGRRDEADRLWKVALARLDSMSTREKYRLLGIYYGMVTRNYDTAIETYEALVRDYPADGAGHNNLAYLYFHKLDFKRALQEGSRLLQVYSNSPLYRSNYALYAMYAGDFDTAVRQAQRLVDEKQASYDTFLPLAMAQLAKADRAGAVKVYEAMAATGAPGRSLSVLGLADIALAEGRPKDAASLLRDGISDDGKTENEAGITSKRVVLAEALLEQGNLRSAVAAVRAALEQEKAPSVSVPAVRVLLAARRDAEAAALGAELDNQLDRQSRAYGRMVAGLIALARGRKVQAVEAYREALKLADVWLLRFNLGLAFVETGYYAEALKEFESCQQRRGEASAVFLNDEPTARYQVPVGYWIGRSKEGLGLLPQAQENYRAFVALRAADSADALLRDARQRLVGRR